MNPSIRQSIISVGVFFNAFVASMVLLSTPLDLADLGSKAYAFSPQSTQLSESKCLYTQDDSATDAVVAPTSAEQHALVEWSASVDRRAFSNFQQNYRALTDKIALAMTPSHSSATDATSDCLSTLKESRKHLFSQDPDALEDVSSLCSNVLDSPISTAPSLFTKYQAKRAASQVFAQINQIYTKIGREQALEQNRQGLKKTSHLDEKTKIELEADVIKMPTLVSPMAAIAAFFGDAGRRAQGHRACEISTDGLDLCQRDPGQTPSQFNLKGASVAAANIPAPLPSKYYETESLDLKRPPQAFVLPNRLATQNISEVALPPPQLAV